MIFPIAVVIVILAGYYVYLRSQELFVISIRNGKLSLTRGYASSSVLSHFSHAASRVQNGEIRAHKTSGGARLSFRGIDSGTAQQLRNAFGLVPMSRLRAPDLDGRRVVSDAFTIAWLLSLFRSFFR